ncbi:hypothetical protein [Micromonospora sp. WMMD714]|uniref:hypothetical protein n=1 Tax=Micromonospora sp. WMMD714 TaxID=3016097 RepID=UPI00249C1316|nr:hypothetical protein [Micromonospora sp. WMMD714]WFE64070.1 hypothetical protein O7625_12645 [Micromonospora sp. WMMD714]
MSGRRQAVRLLTVGALLGGLVAVGAPPAYADSDRVRVRASGGFSAGGPPGGVSIEVRKRSGGCVVLRTALGLSLDGITAEQVRVEVNVGGGWSAVPVSGGGGVVRGSRTPSADPTLCKGKSSVVRYRVAFLAGAPAGRLGVVGEATTAAGRLIGRGADTSRVGGRAAGTPTPTPSSTPTRKPTPTPVATTPASTMEPGATQAVLAAPPSTGRAAAETSGGSMIMFAGIALVVLGAGLIALLIFRSRADRAGADPGRAADPGDFPAVPQPRNPVPTTYRSGGAVPVPPPPPPSGQVYGGQQPAGQVYGGQQSPSPAGQVYGGQPPPSAPTRTGGLYGAPGTYPAVTPHQRPAGAVYGARPAAAPDRPVSVSPAPDHPVSVPPAPGRPVSVPPAAAASVSVPPAAAVPVPDRPGSAPPAAAVPVPDRPGSAPPAAAASVPGPPASAASVPGPPPAAVPVPERPSSAPERPDPTPTTGGDPTTIAPQLPG